ncbi:MAG: peptide ABC transporter substrate-binding protein, partial [Microbacterium sp.]|nr:peptide ABC transporter substrate-binding protein [Microbacterium sp.]
MSLHHPRRGRLVLAIGAIGASAVVLAGCAGGGGGNATGGNSSAPLIVGTTDKITSIDPAGSYDNGSFAVMNHVYPFLLNSKYGTADVTPDIATSAEFTSPTEYTVKLKSGLKFANGHDLTSSDVKFSFDRVIKINDPNGPASLLGNLASIATPDATTVVFTLKNPNDQVWPQILSSPAAPIVDEQVFSADKVTPDDDIVKGDAFAGQYKITSYKVNELINYVPNADYKGELGAADNKGITVKYYADASNLKLDVGNGDIDVAYRSLSATDVADLSKNSKVQVVSGPGGEIRYIVFNFNTMPFGAKTANADPAKALAVRQAMADLVDRDKIASDVYKNTYTPLYSYVPKGLTGANEALKGLYGDGKGGPDADKAKKTLA